MWHSVTFVLKHLEGLSLQLRSRHSVQYMTMSHRLAEYRLHFNTVAHALCEAPSYRQ